MPLEPDRHYARNPRAVAVLSGSRAFWTLPGSPVLHADRAPSATATLWELLATPLSGSALAGQLATDPEAAALEHLLDRLIAQAIVLRGTPDELPPVPAESAAPRPTADPLPCARLVLGVTGAVQAAFVGPSIRLLALEFATRVDVILTRTARRFITPHAVEALGVTAWSNPFEQRDGIRVPHAELAESADLVLVLPASAHAIFRFAHAVCGDLLSLVVAGTRAPVVIAPSMSAAMWSNPAVRRNVARLRDDGAYVIEPGPGRSVASDSTSVVGGLGLGGDTANLLDALRSVLELSR